MFFVISYHHNHVTQDKVNDFLKKWLLNEEAKTDAKKNSKRKKVHCLTHCFDLSHPSMLSTLNSFLCRVAKKTAPPRRRTVVQVPMRSRIDEKKRTAVLACGIDFRVCKKSCTILEIQLKATSQSPHAAALSAKAWAFLLPILPLPRPCFLYTGRTCQLGSVNNRDSCAITQPAL
jgi:hypothetical protein